MTSSHNPGFRVAITDRVPPGDKLMVYKAFEIAQPGDIIVIEAPGYTSVAQVDRPKRLAQGWTGRSQCPWRLEECLCCPAISLRPIHTVSW